MLVRGQLRLHLMAGLPAALMMFGCLAFYLLQSRRAGQWLGGGTVAGLVCGTAAGLIIVFEMMLWPRKLLRRLRLIPAKYWLAAHLWLGMASLPLAIAHTGFHWGGWLPTIFMLVFAATIISGLYGWLMQLVLPRWLLRHVAAETIYNQIDYVSRQTIEDGKRLIKSACGPRPTQSGLSPALDEDSHQSGGVVVVGAVRRAGRTRGRTLETRQVNASIGDSIPLWNALDELTPFLAKGSLSKSPVTEIRDQQRWFERLRLVCGPSSQPIIDALESMCDQRRQFDAQQTAHRWLHAWLPVHIGLSIGVTVLLGAHVVTALMYW